MLDKHKLQGNHLKMWTPFIWAIIFLLFVSGCSGASESQTYTIGVANLSASFDPILEGFKAGMEEAGYVEGQNVKYIYEGPAANPDALNEVIANLKSKRVDLVLSFGTLATLRAKEGLDGTDIPIIFGPVTDPVASGIVTELRRPGGNATGIQTGNPTPKRLEWLLTFAPETNRIYVFHNPNDNSSIQSLAALTEAAHDFNVELVVYEADTSEEISAGLDKMPEDVDAIFVLATALFEANMKQFVTAADAKRLPLSAPATGNVWEGALTSFGHDNVPLGRQASGLAVQILRGNKAADLPVESAELFLSLNLKTAKAINLTFSDNVLRQVNIIVR